MESSKHRGLVVATVAISLFANLSCEESVQGPHRQSKPSSSSSVWITLRGTVTSYDTGEPVENVKVSAYRIHSADRADSAMVTVLTDQYGKYVLTFSNRCDGSWYGLRVRKAGSPNLYPKAASERIWPLPDSICAGSHRTIDIQVVGLVS